VQIAATVVYCLFAAGIIFGYAALKPVLKKEGAYRETCSVSNDDPDSINTCGEYLRESLLRLDVETEN
jgi:hypothetical protein